MASIRADDAARSFAGTVVSTDAIPAELKSYPAWIVWRYEDTGKPKPDKVPYVPGQSRRASTIDLRTWRTFIEAVKAYEARDWAGLGFVFSSGDPFCGIDLDDCRNPETGEVESWAEKIIAAAGPDAYVEASPSGGGLHIVVKGRAPNSKRGPVEAYSERRFFTMTGSTL